MKIFITGATGCVGAHTARELIDAGHQVRLLVRNKKVAQDYFAELGYQLDDFVVADMTDADAVRNGLQGCDAVVHSAAIIDLNPSNAEKTISNNLKGFDNVVGTACELGISKILYVSSMSVFFTPGATVVNEKSTMCDSTDAYTHSKKLCEDKARELQRQGKPVIVTYPASIFGPDDPKLSESNAAFLKFINLMVPQTSSGIQCIDVRDLARSHRLLLEKPLNTNLEAERYMVGGHFLPWRKLATVLGNASGLPIRSFPVPAWLFLLIGKLFDVARLFMSIGFPLSVESTRIITSMPEADSSHLLATVNMKFRDSHDTFKDTVTWLRKKKYLNK